MIISIFLALALTVVQATTLPKRENDHLQGRTIAAKQGYQITFFDDFNSRPGPFIDSKWLIDTGTSYPGGPASWGNAESESYTTSTASLSITPSGTLLITPQHLGNGTWISGRIETARGDFACLPGKRMYIESRLKVGNASVALQQGIWPAFWSLGSAFRGNYSNWPGVGEWDLFESVNGLPNMYTTAHCGTAPGGFCNEYNGIGNSGTTAFSRGIWHTVGFMVDRSTGNWKTESLTCYLDGVQTFSVTGARVGDQATWSVLAHNPHFLLLNVAVGGSFPSAVAGKSTPTKATIGGLSVGMEVDYVVVYNS